MAYLCYVYGWTITYVRSLKYDDFIMMLHSAHMIKGYEKLSDIQNHQYPTLAKKSDKKNLIRAVNSEINKYRDRGSELKGIDELVGNLKQQFAKARKQ